MLCAVIPIRNERGSIGHVIRAVTAAGADRVITVINGCTDGSAAIVLEHGRDGRVLPVYFREPLGIDVPRAVGASLAKELNAAAVLFVDGDMQGVSAHTLQELSAAILDRGCDCALVDCYPPDGSKTPASPLALYLMKIRTLLNAAAGLDHLGAATPTHGPHALSKRFLENVPLRELAVPPVAVVMGAQAGLNFCVAAAVPHEALGSPNRSERHVTRLAETIIGDYIEAFCVLQQKERSRSLRGRTYEGYNRERRFDILEHIIA
ncbi:MAG: glycosyltransferase family 2 protein [Bacillota bacterium]|uniref:glycosyltransferase family 2 protein n=1 Tax=Desulforudis sp. DRI-14 TaxID=3459793 RepID=UPI003BD052BB